MLDSLKQMDTAREVGQYQDQPRQMPAAASGKVGELRLGFSVKDGRSVLHDLYRVAPLLVQQALYWDEEMPELPICSIISVGGGILQGDRYQIDIDVQKNARAHVTSQGANRIHQMDANYASQFQTVQVDSGAYLEYLPDFTIPYRQSRFISRTELTVAEDATLLYGEMMMTGRKHHREDERFGFDLLSLSTQLKRPDGSVLFNEKILVEADNPTIDYAAVMGSYDAFANVLCATPVDVAQRIQARYQTRFDDEDGDRSVVAAVSQLPNNVGLMLRVVGIESYHVRNEVRKFWQIVREEAVGKTLPTPFLWQ